MRPIKLALVVLMTVWLQAGFLAGWRPLGVVPNLMVIIVVYAGLMASPLEAVVLGLSGGIMLDFYSGADFGLRTAFYSMLAVAVAVVHRAGAESSSQGMAVVLVAGASVMFNLAVMATLAGADTLHHLPSMLEAVGVETVINVFLAIILGPLLRPVLGRRPGLASVEVAAA